MALRVLTPIRKRLRGGRGKPQAARLEQLNNQFSRVVSSNLQGGLITFGKRVNYDTLADAVYSGNWKNVYAKIPTQYLPSDIEASMQRLGISVERASEITASHIPFGRGVDPDAYLVTTSNPKLADYIDVRSGALITDIKDSMQANVQNTLRYGLDNKLTAEQIADKIKDTGIGLNERQNIAMRNFEAARRAEGLDGLALANRLEEQASRYLAQRCDMIARTEVSYAQNFAQLETWGQAQADGVISANATKIWVVDGDPCPICRDLQGQEVPLDEKFETSDGDLLDGAPAHVNCLCSLEIGNT